MRLSRCRPISNSLQILVGGFRCLDFFFLWFSFSLVAFGRLFLFFPVYFQFRLAPHDWASVPNLWIQVGRAGASTLPFMYFSFGVCLAFAVLSAIRLLFSPHISVLDWPTTVWLSGFACIQCCLRTLLVESGHWRFFFYTITTLDVSSLGLRFLF